MFLARKISRAKWAVTRELSEGEIPADAVTADLRTQSNSLSFWRCSTDSDYDVDGAALAIASAGNRIDKLDIVWVDYEDLESEHHAVTDTMGRTAVTDMVGMHVDVSRLDYVRLGMVARSVAGAIEANRCRRLTKRRVKALIEQAVVQGRIDPNALSEGLREELAV